MAVLHVWEKYNVTKTLSGYTWTFKTTTETTTSSYLYTWILAFYKGLLTVIDGNTYVNFSNWSSITGSSPSTFYLGDGDSSSKGAGSTSYCYAAARGSSSAKNPFTRVTIDGVTYYDLSVAEKMIQPATRNNGVQITDDGYLALINEWPFYQATKTSNYSYSKGDFIEDVSSVSSNAYPNDGYSGNYWYVYKGAESINNAGVDGTVKDVKTVVCVNGVVKTNISLYQCVNGVIKQS